MLIILVLVLIVIVISSRSKEAKPVPSFKQMLIAWGILIALIGGVALIVLLISAGETTLEEVIKGAALLFGLYQVKRFLAWRDRRKPAELEATQYTLEETLEEALEEALDL